EPRIRAISPNTVRPWVASKTAIMKLPPNRPRQKRIVHESNGTSRVKNGAVLQATAAAVTSAIPVPCCEWPRMKAIPRFGSSLSSIRKGGRPLPNAGADTRWQQHEQNFKVSQQLGRTGRGDPRTGIDSGQGRDARPPFISDEPHSLAERQTGPDAQECDTG